MEPDQTKAVWHVLRRIKNSQTDGSKVLFNLYEFGANSSSPSSDHQYNALVYLRDAGVVEFNEEAAIGFVEPDITYTQYELLIADGASLDKLHVDYEKLAQEQARKAPIAVSFDGEIARINGLPYSLRGKNKKLFNALYKHANIWITQTEALKVLRYSDVYNSKSANQDFNIYIGNLRKALHLTTSHIVVNDKHVMLKCEVEK